MRERHSIKSHRKRSGFTQEELGFLFGLKKEPTSICRFETGDRYPTLKVAFAYAALLGRDVSELFPALEDEARAEVGARARQLSQEIRKQGEDKRSAHKLKQLARLANEAHVLAV